MFADLSKDTMCAVAYLRSQPKKYSADLALVVGKEQSGTNEASFNTPIGIASGSPGSSKVKEHEMKINSCNFWSESTTVLLLIHSSHRKHQVFVANRMSEILDTTDFSLLKHVSGINNPADIGTRAINIEEFKCVAQWAGLVEATRK